MRTHKRWVLGTISGFFFGLFLGLTLLGFGVLALDSPALTILPVAGLVVGLAGSLWGPIKPKVKPALAPEPVVVRAQGFAPPPSAETPSEPPADSTPPPAEPPTTEG